MKSYRAMLQNLTDLACINDLFYQLQWQKYILIVRSKQLNFQMLFLNFFFLAPKYTDLLPKYELGTFFFFFFF